MPPGKGAPMKPGGGRGGPPIMLPRALTGAPVSTAFFSAAKHKRTTSKTNKNLRRKRSAAQCSAHACWEPRQLDDLTHLQATTARTDKHTAHGNTYILMNEYSIVRKEFAAALTQGRRRRHSSHAYPLLESPLCGRGPSRPQPVFLSLLRIFV